MSLADLVGCINADWRANIFLKSRIILLLFRVAGYFAHKGKPGLILGSPVILFYIIFVEWLLGVEIPVKTNIGKGFVIYHGYGLVINGYSVIGSNVLVRQGCCLGNKLNKDGSFTGAPVIGNGVEMGVNAVVLGNVVVGDNVQIGAGAVVVKNCDPNSIYVGIPARRVT